MLETYKAYRVFFRLSEGGDSINHICYSDQDALQFVHDLEKLDIQQGGTPTNGMLGCNEAMHYRIISERGVHVTKTDLEKILQGKKAQEASSCAAAD